MSHQNLNSDFRSTAMTQHRSIKTTYLSIEDVPAGDDLMMPRKIVQLELNVAGNSRGGDVEREVRLPWHPDVSSSLLLPWRSLNFVMF